MSVKKNKEIDFSSIIAVSTTKEEQLTPCNYLLRNNKLCSVSTSDTKSCNYHSSETQLEGEKNLKFTILRTLDDALNQVLADQVLDEADILYEKKMLLNNGFRTTLLGTFDELPTKYQDKPCYTMLKDLFYRLIVGEDDNE